MARPIDLARVRAAEDAVDRAPAAAARAGERTARFLAGDPSIKTMERLMTERLEKPTHLRLPRDVHERAEASRRSLRRTRSCALWGGCRRPRCYGWPYCMGWRSWSSARADKAKASQSARLITQGEPPAC